jgi:hypothetical protein
MHNGRVCADWASEDAVGIGKVDDDDLSLFINLFSYANKVVGFERQCLGRRDGDLVSAQRRALQTWLTWKDIEAG